MTTNDDKVLRAVCDAMSKCGHVTPSCDYRPGAESIIESLAEQGYQITRIRNAYADTDPYTSHLTVNQRAVLTLVTFEQYGSTVENISHQTGLTTPKVKRALASLTRRQFVSRVRCGPYDQYHPTPFGIARLERNRS